MHLAAGCVAAGRGLADEAEAHVRAAEEVAASLKYGQENVYAAMARALWSARRTGDYLGMADALGPWQDDSALDARSRLYAVLVEAFAGRRPRRFGPIGAGRRCPRPFPGGGSGCALPPAGSGHGWTAGWPSTGVPRKPLWRSVPARRGHARTLTARCMRLGLLLAHGRLAAPARPAPPCPRAPPASS